MNVKISHPSESQMRGSYSPPPRPPPQGVSESVKAITAIFKGTHLAFAWDGNTFFFPPYNLRKKSANPDSLWGSSLMHESHGDTLAHGLFYAFIISFCLFVLF